MWRRLMLKLSWQRLQNRLHLVANTAKIGPSGLMEKGLIVCLDLKFEYRQPEKENGPFNLAVEEEKDFKEAVDLNKKATGQFIQAFLTMREQLNSFRVEEHGKCGRNCRWSTILMIQLRN